MKCKDKIPYPNRMAAESALAMARRDWARDPRRAAQPPKGVYRCDRCRRWHMTHHPITGDTI